MLSITFFTLVWAITVSAQIPASQLDLLDAQWVASGFDQALSNSNSFGVPLQAEGLLTVNYGSATVQNGQSLTNTQVASLPSLYITPGEGAASNFSNAVFTVMLADANAAGDYDPSGDYRHYLVNSVPASNTGSSMQLELSQGKTITAYAGPGPLAGSGTHRYAWMLFDQPSSFEAPASLSNTVAPGKWQVSQYVSQSGLGALVAASWFTVSASGQNTFQPVSTTAVSTVAPAQTTDTGVAAVQTSTALTVASATTSTTSAPAVTSAHSGAVSLRFAPPAIAALALAAVLHGVCI